MHIKNTMSFADEKKIANKPHETIHGLFAYEQKFLSGSSLGLDSSPEN